MTACLRPALLFMLFAIAVPCPAADGIGVFTVVDGEVRILRDAQWLAAEIGVEAERDDIVETGVDAAAQLDMEDGSVLSLGPQTRLALTQYRLDDSNSVVAAGLDLLAGWLRFAVAKLKPNSEYAFQTPTLTVGVRGTEGVIEAGNDESGLHLVEGAVEVGTAGEGERARERVVAGEYVQRRRGQGLARMTQAPPAFRKRMPRGLDRRLARRAHQLKRRGVPPRTIRRLNPGDARDLMQRHPHMRERWHKRFGPTASPGGVAAPVSPERLRERKERWERRRDNAAGQPHQLPRERDNPGADRRPQNRHPRPGREPALRNNFRQ